MALHSTALETVWESRGVVNLCDNLLSLGDEIHNYHLSLAEKKSEEKKS